MVPVSSNNKCHTQQEVDHHFLHWQTRLEMFFHPLTAIQPIALCAPSCFSHSIGCLFATSTRITQTLLMHFILLASFGTAAVLRGCPRRCPNSNGSDRLLRVSSILCRVSWRCALVTSCSRRVR